MFFDYPLNYVVADMTPRRRLEQGFMANDLNDRSWLRGFLSHNIPSEAQILRELDWRSKASHKLKSLET